MSSIRTSLIHSVTDRLRDRLVDRFGLAEVAAPPGVLRRTSDGSEVGSVRVWTGDRVDKVVDVRLVVPDLGIDSSMLHAFTASSSPAPRLVSDLAGLPHGVNFHVDLVPKVDLAAEATYLDTVYPPLTDARTAAYAVAGATAVAVPLRLVAFSSPWLVGVTVPPEGVADVEPVYDAYLDRFAELLAADQDGLTTVPGEQVASRDRAVRRAQFDAASDPVWDFLADLVGAGPVDQLLHHLHEPTRP